MKASDAAGPLTEWSVRSFTRDLFNALPQNILLGIVHVILDVTKHMGVKNKTKS